MQLCAPALSHLPIPERRIEARALLGAICLVVVCCY